MFGRRFESAHLHNEATGRWLFYRYMYDCVAPNPLIITALLCFHLALQSYDKLLLFSHLIATLKCCLLLPTIAKHPLYDYLCAMKWYAIRVTYGRERKFCKALEEDGFETFVPAVSNLCFVRTEKEALDAYMTGLGEACPARYMWDKATRNPIIGQGNGRLHKGKPHYGG